LCLINEVEKKKLKKSKSEISIDLNKVNENTKNFINSTIGITDIQNCLNKNM